MFGIAIQTTGHKVDWLQSLKQFFINVSYHILVASLTLMALSKNRAIRVRLATSICFDTMMENCLKDWSQSRHKETSCIMHINHPSNP